MKTNSLDFDAQALREKILDLAMRGKLVPQDPNDEPASVLLEKIKAEKAELIKEKKIKKSKPLPEITDDEKPFDIPDSWEWVRLGDVGNWAAGATPSRKHPEYYCGDIPWLKTGDLNDDVVEDTTEKITKLGVENSSVKINKPGNVLIAMYGATIGKLGIVGSKELVTNQACCGCTPFNGIYNWFLFYYLFASRKRLINLGSGGAQPNISKQKIEKFSFPLPPSSEQNRIAAKIAQLFALLRKVESSTQQYAELQTLLKSKVLDLAMRGKLVEQNPNDEPASVLLEKNNLKSSDEKPHDIPTSWKWIVLGSGVNFYNGRAFKKNELLSNDKLTPVLRVGNLFTNSSWYYSDLKLDPNKYIDNGDLIYAWSASFGPKIWNDGHVIYHYHIWKLKYDGNAIDKRFLYYFLLNKRNVVGETDLHGSTMKHITKTNMEHLPFPLPPLSEQIRIIVKIAQLFALL